MGYEHLFAKCDLALLYDWLQEVGELYMDLDRPHSGALNNSVYFINSLAEINAIVSRETFPEVCIYIFREKQYPIRGICDDLLLTAALKQIPDGQWFSLISLGDGPLAPCNVVGSGNSHDELRDEFNRHKGEIIRLGQNPFDEADTNFFEQPDNVWVVRYRRHPQPHVSKNRTRYVPFDTWPERYHPYLDF